MPAAKKAVTKKAVAPKKTRAAKLGNADVQQAPTELAAPTELDFNAALAEWAALKDKIKEQIDPLVKREMELRKLVFAGAFPNPKEGTNTLDLGGGWQLQATHKIDRSIDETVLPIVMQQMPEGSEAFLIKYKPGLVVSVWRTLPADLRKVFDQCVSEKPGAPALTLVSPTAQ